MLLLSVCVSSYDHLVIAVGTQPQDPQIHNLVGAVCLDGRKAARELDLIVSEDFVHGDEPVVVSGGSLTAYTAIATYVLSQASTFLIVRVAHHTCRSHR